VWWNDSKLGKNVLGEEPDPQPICPPHILRELPYEEKWISVERSRQLSSGPVAPLISCAGNVLHYTPVDISKHY